MHALLPLAPLPRRRAALTLAALSLALVACSEPSTPVCASQIAEEVCATPGQLRGAEPVLPGASATGVQLPAQPLADGRYVLVSAAYSCPEGVAAPAAASVRGVLELSGCVLRRTLVPEELEPRVDVFQLEYAGEGTLALERRCPPSEAGALQASYGFDGERLELGRLQASTVQDSEEGLACDTLETWELR